VEECKLPFTSTGAVVEDVTNPW